MQLDEIARRDARTDFEQSTSGSLESVRLLETDRRTAFLLARHSLTSWPSPNRGALRDDTVPEISQILGLESFRSRRVERGGGAVYEPND